MKQLYKLVSITFFSFLIGHNLQAQLCSYAATINADTDICDGGTFNLDLDFDIDMSTSTINITDDVTGTDYIGTPAGGNRVNWAIPLNHSLGNPCAVEVHTFTINVGTSLCSDGATPPNDNGFTTSVNVMPPQPTYQIQNGNICSGGTVTFDIFVNGQDCGDHTITAPTNQGCTVMTSLDYDIDYATILGVSDPLGCWTNVSFGTYSADGAGTPYTIFPEQPTWRVQGDNAVCSGGMFTLEIFGADGVTSCGVVMVTANANTSCDFDMAGVPITIDYETVLGITGADAACGWIDETGGLVTADPGGTNLYVYPTQLDWRIQGNGEICSGGTVMIDIVDGNGVVCTNIAAQAVTVNANMGCTVLNDVTLSIDYAALFTAPGDATQTPASLACWTATNGTFTADGAGTMFQIVPEQFTYATQAPYAICGDGATTITLDILAADGSMCGTHTMTPPQNTTCTETNSYNVTITLADMETAAGLTPGILTNNAGACGLADINEDMSANANPVFTHPDPALVDWYVTTATTVFCGSADIDVQLRVNGVDCGSPFMFNITHDGTCAMWDNSDFAALSHMITAADIEMELGITTSATCYTDFSIDLDNDPNGYMLELYPDGAGFTAVASAGNPTDVCSAQAGAISVDILDGGGGVCGTVMFDAPMNETCVPLASYDDVVTAAQIEAVIANSNGTGTACFSDINFSIGVNTWPAQPSAIDVTINNATPCSEEAAVVTWEIVSADGTTCATGGDVVDAPQNQTCATMSPLDFTVTGADIETAIGAPAGLCGYTDIMVSEPGVEISPEAPTMIVLNGSIDTEVCSGDPTNPATTADIIGPDGATICDNVPIFLPENLGCDPFLDEDVSVNYGPNDWAAISGGRRACWTFALSEMITTDVYPAPMTLDSSGSLQCDDPLIATLIAENGSECFSQSIACEADNDRFMFDFTDLATPNGTSISWDWAAWQAVCGADPALMGEVGPCRDCPEICAFGNPTAPYWTSFCPDATPICDPRLFNFSSCTPPVANEDFACEPGTLCFAGVPNNMTWFAFIAGTIPGTSLPSPISITITQIGICIGSLQGVQAGIYDACACDGGTCLSGSGACPGSVVSINVPNPIAGATYYIFIDGCAGAQCFFDVSINQADPFTWPCPELPQLTACDEIPANFTEPNTFCMVDGVVNVYAENAEYLDLAGVLGSTFTYSISSSTGSALPIPSPYQDVNPFVDLVFTEVGDYTFCFEGAENACDDTSDCSPIPQCVDIHIVELPDVTFETYEACYAEVAQLGYFPPPSPDGYLWQGPVLYPWDLDLNGCYEFDATNGCGCSYKQNVCMILEDNVPPVDYDVYLCDLTEQWCYQSIFGQNCFRIGDAIGELIYLPGLAPNGCDLPVFLSVLELSIDYRLDTIASSCNSMELEFNILDQLPANNNVVVDILWEDAGGNFLGNGTSQLFLSEADYMVTYTLTYYNNFSEQFTCTETIPFSIEFEPLGISNPSFIDPQTVFCPNVPVDVTYNLLDRGDMNMITVTPANIATSNISNTTVTVSLDGSTPVQICVIAENNCDGMPVVSGQTCIDIGYTGIQNFSVTLPDTICVDGSATAQFVGNTGIIDTFFWDNEMDSLNDNTMYTWTTGGLQTVELYVQDTFGCIFGPESAQVYVDTLEFLNVSVQPDLCYDPNGGAQIVQVSFSGPGNLLPQAGLNTATGGFTVPGPGSYTFEMVPTTTVGCTPAGAMATLDVVEIPSPDFTTNTPICLEAGGVVNVTSPGQAVTHQWFTPGGMNDLGAGGTDASFNVTYASAGTYDIALVLNAGSCFSDTLRQQVEIYPEFVLPQFTCFGTGIDFIDFQWQAIPGISMYDVEVINVTQANSVIFSGAQPNSDYFVNGLAEADSVCITVSPIDPNGCNITPVQACCVAKQCTDPGVVLPMPYYLCLDGLDANTASFDILADMTIPIAPMSADFSGVGVSDAQNGTFDPLATPGAGTYNVIYSYVDDLGCRTNYIIEVNLFNAPTADFTFSSPVCLGDPVTITYNGNEQNLDNYDWSSTGATVNPIAPSSNIFNVEFTSTGTFDISLTTSEHGANFGGCSNSLTLPIEILDTLQPFSISCGAAWKDSVTFEWGAVVGASMYEVYIDGVLVGTQAGTSYSETGLAEAQTVNIRVVAINDNGCSNTEATMDCTTLFCRPDYPVTLGPQGLEFCSYDTQAVPLTADVSQIPANEAGSGEFTIEHGVVADGNGGFEFDPTGLAAGTYTVHYTYLNIIDCPYEYEMDIIIYDPPSAEFDVSDVCLDTDTPVNYLGNPNNVTLVWDIGDAISTDFDPTSTSQTSFNVQWDNDGDHFIMLTTTRNGCTASSTETITVTDNVVITLDGPTGPVCYDPAGILITPTWVPMAGTGRWLDPRVNNITNRFLPDPTGGTYTLDYEVDLGGCIYNESITIEVLETPTINNAGTELHCELTPIVLMSTSSGAGAISWDLDGGTLVSGDPATNGPLEVMYVPGTYNITTTIDNGTCSAESMRPLVVEPALDTLMISCLEEITTMTFSWDPIDCATEFNISIDGVFFETTTDLSVTLTNLDPERDVTIVITALSDCQCPATITQSGCTTLPCPDWSVNFSQNSIDYCLGESVTVDLNPQLLPAPTSAGVSTWEGPGVNDQGIFDGFGIAAGSYDLIYTHSDGPCEFKDTVVLNVSDIPKINIDPQNPTCYLDNVGLIIPDITDAFGNVMFEYGGNVIDPYAIGDPIEGIAPGTYQVTVTAGDNCSATAEFTINPAPEPSVDILGADIQTVGVPETYNFTLTPPSFSVAFDSIVWTYNNEIICNGTDCLDIILDQSDEATDTLCVQLFYNDGCFIETCKLVTIREIKQIYIPNIISIDAATDKNKGLYFFTNAETTLVHDVTVYDRWGNKIYTREIEELVGTDQEIVDGVEAKNDVFLWGGTWGELADGGEIVQPGVYVYVVNYTENPGSADAQSDNKVGDVTVIR